MKIRDMFTKEFYDKYGDVDVYNDVTDEDASAYCGTLLTPAGERRYEKVLELEVEFLPDNGYYCNRVIVKVDGPNWEKLWDQVCLMFAYAAGYCDEKTYTTLFKEV